MVLAREKKGVPMSDVWEIPFLNPKAKERTGYPTQKPVELLERIIRISTDPGDCVLDPFCGSGTTLVAAKLLGRNYVGIDSNPSAVRLCGQRLECPAKTESRLLKVGIDSYKTKTEEELALLNTLGCDVVQRNKGIDGILKTYYRNAPVAVKIQKKHESLQEAADLLCRAGNKKRCSFLVLVRTSRSAGDQEAAVPANMIVMDSPELLLENELSNQCSLYGVKSAQML